jgi:hypothetical protein
MTQQRIIFVYNANSGKGKAILDSLHKMISPSTYDCNLCALTHGSFGPKKEWNNFLSRIDASLEFYHKDEYEKQLGSKFSTAYQLPFILCAYGYDEELLCSAKTINSFTTVSELIMLLESQLF